MSQEANARPRVTAGVAVLGASAIAIGPAAAPLPDPVELQTHAVQLAAVNFDAWSDLFTTTETTAGDLFDHVSGAPFAALQQLLVNQINNIQELLGGNVQGVLTNIDDNVTAAGNAAVTPFLPDDAPSYVYPSLDSTSTTLSLGVGTGSGGFLGIPEQIGLDLDIPGGHVGLLELLSGGLALPNPIYDLPLVGDLLDFLGIDVPHTIDLPSLLSLLVPDAATQQEISSVLDFAASPLSGVLWGDIGTILSPILQLNDDVTGIGDAISGSDWNTVLQDVVDAPANILNAFLNGYGNVDLLSILQAAGIDLDAGPLTAQMPLALGGLLSPGGSLFDAIGLNAHLTLSLLGGDACTDILTVCGGLDFDALPVGPLGSLVELGQAIANAIGWDDLGSQPIDGLAGIF